MLKAIKKSVAYVDKHLTQQPTVGNIFSEPLSFGASALMNQLAGSLAILC
jgi:hypothetical protein